MPYYKVKEKGADKPRLIEASTPAGALRHAAASHFTVEIATQAALVSLMSDGVKVEKAGDAPAEAAEGGE